MKGNWTRASWVTIAALLLIASSNINWGKDHWRTVLQADAKGYYAYLPALFIYDDPNLGFFDRIERETYYDANTFYDYRFGFEGHIVDKYFMGTAIAQLPFFLGTHALVSATGGLADGYSKPYVVAVNLAAIAWVLVGLFCMAKLLRTYGIDDRWIAFLMLAYTFGTNLFYYTVVAPGMSHAYSFGLCSAFLLLGRALPGRASTSRVILLGALLGLIVLTRPVNGLLLFALPLLWDRMPTRSEAWTLIREHAIAILASMVLAIAIASLQLLYYHSATGSIGVYAYGEEGFNWIDPHMLDILFSYRKGLFLYMPLLLLSLPGLYYLHQRSPVAAWWWIGFLLLLTYVLSAWWNWWYGGSFGARVYVEYLGLFMLLAAFALQHLRTQWRKGLMSLMVLAVVLCQVQTYQMRYYQIHWEDMDRARYWEVFLRLDKLP